MGCGTVSLGCRRVVDTAINADVVKNIIVNGHECQRTIFLIFLARIYPKGLNNVRLVRDSELGAVNSAKPEAMPGFELRMGGIVGINRMPVKIDKSGMS
jgi:hypothetical protein